MGQLHYVPCPRCGFTYPIDEMVFKAGVDAHCPRCHHEFRPQEGGFHPARADKP